jgi:hypothetical protein
MGSDGRFVHAMLAAMTAPAQTPKKKRGNQHKPEYTDEFKALALETLDLCEGNVKAAAIAMHMPRKTLEGWRDADPERLAALVPIRTEKRGELATKIETVIHQLVESMPAKIQNATLSQTSVALGILTDKVVKLRGHGLHPDFESELCSMLGINRQQLPERLDLNELFAGTNPAQVIDVSPEPVQLGFTADQQPLFLHNGQLFTQSPDGELIPFTPPAPAYSAIPDPLNPPPLGIPIVVSEDVPPCSSQMTSISDITSSLSKQRITEIADAAADDIIRAGKDIAANTLERLKDQIPLASSEDVYETLACNSCDYVLHLPFQPNRQPEPCPTCFKGVLSRQLSGSLEGKSVIPLHRATSPNSCACGFSGPIHALTQHFASATLSERVRNTNLSRHSQTCTLRFNSSADCSCELSQTGQTSENPSQDPSAEATDDTKLIESLADDDLSN